LSAVVVQVEMLTQQQTNPAAAEAAEGFCSEV
jgi:hypothetical protein